MEFYEKGEVGGKIRFGHEPGPPGALERQTELPEGVATMGETRERSVRIYSRRWGGCNAGESLVKRHEVLWNIASTSQKTLECLIYNALRSEYFEILICQPSLF